MSKVFIPMNMENLVKMLDDKEDARLQKLYEEWVKKQQSGEHKEHQQKQTQSTGGGMGFGGMAGGMKGMANTLKK